MNDIRRTVLWVIFGITMVMLWDQWQVYNGHKPTFFSAPASQTAGAGAPGARAGDVPTASPSGAATAAGGAAPLAGSQVPASAPQAPREQVVVSTDVLKLTFDTEGGSLVRAELLGHRDAQHPEQNVVLLDQTAQRVYQAQTGLVGAPAGAAAYPNHKTVMTVVPGPRALEAGQNELTVRFESPEQGGVKVVKTWTMKRGAYDIAVRHDVQNVSATPQNPRLYLQLVRDGNKPEGESSFYFTFTGPVVYTGEKKYQKADFKDIEKGKADYEKRSRDGYVAMVQHYFASAWFLGKPGAAQQDVNVPRELFMRKVDDNLYAVGMIADGPAIAPGASVGTDATFFVGPQKEQMLEQMAPGLELVKDYGWFTIFAKPLYWLLVQLHGILGNWGWAIVGLTFIVKLVFYYPTAKGYESMAKMKAVNPRIMEMRERLKDNPQQMQQEMMRIYREEKVNPMGGCLPMVLPIPIFIALYWVLLSSVEMRGAPWALWIHDLSVPDPYFVLPAIMAVTMLLQTALNPAPPDPVQAKMMWIMPLMFSVMFFFFPSGLVLYYIVNNVLSIAQQWVINKRMGVPPQFNLPKFK